MSKFTVIDPGTGLPYCADPDALSLTRGACTAVPPGPDPSALALAQVIYGGDGLHNVVNNVNMRSFGDIFRGSGDVPVSAWPYHPTVAQSLMPVGKHWRSRIDVPVNALAGFHQLKTVSYYIPGHPLPAGWGVHTIRAAIVPVGADWSAAHAGDGSYIEGVSFQQNRQVLMLSVGEPASTGRAELQRGQSYDLLVAFDNPAYGGGMVFQWN